LYANVNTKYYKSFLIMKHRSIESVADRACFAADKDGEKHGANRALRALFLDPVRRC
jgi:hypothetical protein